MKVITDRSGTGGQWYKSWGFKQSVGGFQRVLAIRKREKRKRAIELFRERGKNKLEKWVAFETKLFFIFLENMGYIN